MEHLDSYSLRKILGYLSIRDLITAQHVSARFKDHSELILAQVEIVHLKFNNFSGVPLYLFSPLCIEEFFEIIKCCRKLKSVVLEQSLCTTSVNTMFVRLGYASELFLVKGIRKLDHILKGLTRHVKTLENLSVVPSLINWTTLKVVSKRLKSVCLMGNGCNFIEFKLMDRYIQALPNSLSELKVCNIHSCFYQLIRFFVKTSSLHSIIFTGNVAKCYCCTIYFNEAMLALLSEQPNRLKQFHFEALGHVVFEDDIEETITRHHISKFYNLEELKLIFNKQTSLNNKTLAAIAKNCRKLKTFKLQYCSRKGNADINNILQELKDLVQIEIHGSNMTTILLNPLCDMTSVKRLKISDCMKLSSKSIDGIVLTSPNLEQLTIQNCGFNLIVLNFHQIAIKALQRNMVFRATMKANGCALAVEILMWPEKSSFYSSMKYFDLIVIEDDELVLSRYINAGNTLLKSRVFKNYKSSWRHYYKT